MGEIKSTSYPSVGHIPKNTDVFYDGPTEVLTYRLHVEHDKYYYLVRFNGKDSNIIFLGQHFDKAVGVFHTCEHAFRWKAHQLREQADIFDMKEKEDE